MGVVGDRGVGPTSASSMMWNRGSQYSGVGTVKVPRPNSSLQAIIRDTMINGAGSYRDIDNAFSAGGHDGNGSPQSTGSLPAEKNYKGKSKKKKTYSDGSSGGSSGGFSSLASHSAAQAFEYYEAPIAEKYGFSPETAYQEALANTAYRREMADMRKAGLNPSVIYGSHNTSGADSDIRPSYSYSSGGHGGSGGSGRRSRRSAGNSGKYLFSGGEYYGIMAAVGTITSIATKNVGAGMAAAGLAGTALKALNGFLKK